LLAQDFSYAVCADRQPHFDYFLHQPALGACLIWHWTISRKPTGYVARLLFDGLTRSDQRSQRPDFGISGTALV